MRMIIFTRYNRIHPDDWRFKKTIGNRGWWKKRLPITKKYFIPSMNQFDCEKWALFTEKINIKYAKKTILALRKAGFQIIVTTSDDKTYLDEPYKEVIKRKYNKEVMLINVDSDDMLHKDYLSALQKAPRATAYYHRRGYIYDHNNKDIYYHNCDNAPPNFNAMLYPISAQKSAEAWLSYKDDNNMNQRHMFLHKANNSHCLPHGLYCHVIHGANTSQTLEQYRGRLKKTNKELSAYGIHK